MNPNKSIVKTVPFILFVAVSQNQSTNPVLDIIFEGEINLESYCLALINKILELPQSQFSNFISYQLNQISDPLNWIDCFDMLITQNEKIFKKNSQLFKYNKLLNLIQQQRDLLQCPIVLKPSKTRVPKRLINAETEERYFCFYQTKSHVETLSNFNDCIIYLTEEIFEYRQAEIISKNNKLQDYDLQCNQLIEKLQTLRKMKTDLGTEPKSTGYPINYVKSEPLQIHGAINILTHVFKQMMTTVKPNGKPYLQCKIKEVSEFICDNFVDENGQPLSPTTIQTYLSPNRNDKDPNGENMITIL